MCLMSWCLSTEAISFDNRLLGREAYDLILGAKSSNQWRNELICPEFML